MRLVVPWKYGFKGIKSIVKISLVAERAADELEPVTAPREYGFYANVNPDHPHPRWSQATEQRIGESGRRRDADVQRLRGAGGAPVQRDGSACRLLTSLRRHPRRVMRPPSSTSASGGGWSSSTPRSPLRFSAGTPGTTSSARTRSSTSSTPRGSSGCSSSRSPWWSRRCGASPLGRSSSRSVARSGSPGSSTCARTSPSSSSSTAPPACRRRSTRSSCAATCRSAPPRSSCWCRWR